MSTLPLGEYEHYKGYRYEVVGIARHSETLEDLVVYRSIDDHDDIWVRPKKMFLEKIERNGKMIPRFKKI